MTQAPPNRPASRRLLLAGKIYLGPMVMRLSITPMSVSAFCCSTLLCIASCAESGPTRAWAGSIQDSAGIRVVHNPEEGLWCPGQEWTLTDALTIGTDVGDTAYEFGNIIGIQVDDSGDIFVFDKMASEIRVFDGEGTHIRSFGGRGEGPGEFSAGAAGMFLTSDNRLTLPDLGNQRISWMSSEGEFLGSTLASYSGGFPVRWDGGRGGSVVVQRRAMGFNEDPDLEAGDPLVRMNEDGTEETLLIMPKAETVWMEGAAARFRYFATEPSWDLGPTGTLRTAMTQNYRIEVRGPGGSLEMVISKADQPEPVTDQDKALFEGLMRDALDRMGLSPTSVQRQIDNLSFGTTFPAFNRLMEGPEGTTLVQRIDALESIDALDLSEEMSRRLGSRSWEVFGPDGRFLGAMDMPARFSPMAWTDDAVYGRWLDDLDRHHVRVLRLARSEDPPGEGCW